ncbi:hypothetical protein NEHOM01_0534 [Nematocida homosporus]|uniref:uncharacterized protein n=1 Tax=Nematocida homosporus TaxID=1912981 RepID=UPI00221F03BC|nr:uncharacterized protein NEHOM01_0534 [Nematocida homosporus]KAI5184983.1 hypothetical protein NEHOM01_0534 [Nematocida homosporus]
MLSSTPKPTSKLLSIEEEMLFTKINKLTNHGSQEDLLNIFKLDAFIRLDNFFISPFSLLSIKRGLRNKLIGWKFSEAGWCFYFQDGIEIFFHGKFTSLIKDKKVVHIKIDTHRIECKSKPHYEILLRYFKCLDTFYFMVTEVDTSFHLLTNPLAANVLWPNE